MYYNGEEGDVLIQEHDELHQLSKIDFERQELSDLASPLRLYTYYLLQQFLGNGSFYGGIGLVPDKKARLVFLNTAFELANMEVPNFSMNNIARLVMKPKFKKELLRVHETFFVLFNPQFKSKLLNALTLYQSETGQEVDKMIWIDHLLDPKRIDQLNIFSIKQIARL